jgi:hypothetical protein
LNVTPQDKPEPEKSATLEPAAPPAEEPGVFKNESAMPAESAATGPVRVTADELAAPYALLSGKATFSDGVTADWMIDEMGRLVFNPSKPGYRPSQADAAAFQRELQRVAELRGL